MVTCRRSAGSTPKIVAFDEAGQGLLGPDVVCKLGGVAVAVADPKYKAEQSTGYPNADLYQLFAYRTVPGLSADT